MNKTLRKIVYLILFALLIWCFIFLSNKYADRSEHKIIMFSDYYSDVENDKRFVVVNANGLMKLLKKDKNVIFIGNSSSKWSIEYAKKLDKFIKDSKLDKIYYYDVENDKIQKNAKYYEIKDMMKGYLVTTSDGNDNLLAPSLYIVNNGDIKYYNVDTVSMKNTIDINDYWDDDREIAFFNEIDIAFRKYYLNK